MKASWISLAAVVGLAFATPALAHADWHPRHGEWRRDALDLNDDGRVSGWERERADGGMRHHSARRHYWAHVRERERFEHRMRARAYAEEARRAGHRARWEGAHGYWR